MESENVERRLLRLERTNRMLMVAVAVLAASALLEGRLPLALGQAKLPRAPVAQVKQNIAPLPAALDNSALRKAIEPPPITPMVRTRVLEIVDEDGARRAWLSTDGSKNALIGLMDSAGRLRTVLSTGASSGLTLHDASGRAVAALVTGSRDRATGTSTKLSMTEGALVLDDAAGNPMVGLRLQPGGHADLHFNSAPNVRHVELRAGPVSGGTRTAQLKLTANDGTAAASVFVGEHIAKMSAMGGVNRAGFEAGGERHLGFLRARSTVRGVQSEVLAIPTRVGGDIEDLLHIESLPAR